MMNLKNLIFTKPTKILLKVREDVEVKGSLYNLASSVPELTEKLEAKPDLISIGIDPGKNFGMAIISKDTCAIMNGVLTDTKYNLREVAFWLANYWVNVTNPIFNVAVIEGASYGDRFGQVKLAEIRCGFSLGISENKIPVNIIAPKTPRKDVFGDGNTGAWDVWINLNHNAADALCLALYPFYTRRFYEETKIAPKLDG